MYDCAPQSRQTAGQRQTTALFCSILFHVYKDSYVNINCEARTSLKMQQDQINDFIASQSSVHSSVSHLQFKSLIKPYSTNCCPGLFTYPSVRENKIKHIKFVLIQ